jgi:serine/threonine-protein kinase
VADALEPGTSFAGHRIDRLLGRGGMGEVYLAEESGSGRRVALKLLPAALAGDERFRARFERESRLAASLSHPHVVPVHGAGDENGALWMALGFVDGPDLRAVIAEHRRLHPADAALIVSQVAGGLDAAAAKGLVHRDVKPGNVFVEAAGGRPHAFLGDFGLSKATDSQSGLTGTGMFLGTIDYAAPEQIQAEPVDATVDVYALGAVLHRALTGEVPFPRTRDVDVAMAHITEPPPRPSESAPGCPAALDDVVAKAMAKQPEDRFASAGELGHAALAAAEAAGSAPEWAAATPSASGDADAPTVA